MASGGQFSPDGQWWWNGREWVPADQAPMEAQKPPKPPAPGPAAGGGPGGPPGGPKRGRGARRWVLLAVGVIALLAIGICTAAVANSPAGRILDCG